MPRRWRAGTVLFALTWLAAAQPPAFDHLLQQGLLALRHGDLSAAAASLEKASRLQPKDARVWLALAQTYQKSGRAELAKQAAARAQDLAPDDPLVLHGLAIFYSESQRWAEAAAVESRYAERAPQDREAYLRAVTFYLQAHQPKPAMALAKKALAAENRPDLHNLLGKAYDQDGQPAQALRELEQAIELAPYDEGYHFDLAYVLLVHQDFAAAVRKLEEARKVFDKSAQIELALGVAYYGQRRFSDAADAFLKTATLAPDLEQPYVFLGRILDQAEARLPEITQKFAAFAAGHPNNYLGAFLHAKALLAQMGPSGDTAQAEALLKKSILLNGQFWESEFQLGLVFEQKRDFAKAAESLERAAQLNSKNSAVHYHLARVYDRLNKPELAVQERALHQKYAEEEKAAADRQAAGLKGLERVVR